MGLSTITRAPYRLARYAWQIWQQARPAARKHNVGTLKIVREQIKLKLANEIQPSEYFHFQLDDPRKSWEEKLSYLGGTRVRKLWYVLTPTRYHHFFKNKLIFKRLFAALGFPLAKLHGVYDPQWGHTEDGAPLCSAADIAAWMRSSDVQDPVFKPIESAEGRMVLVMAGRKPGDLMTFVSLNGEEYSPKRIAAFLNDPRRLREAYPDYPAPLRTMLVEERLRPHPALRELAPETLCCARVLTLTTLDGKVEIIFAAMKLQSDPSGVDNVTQGSVAIAVDPETGVMGTGLLAVDGPDNRRTAMPGTGQRFTGFQLPQWNEVIDLAKSAAAAFPHAHTVGWDVAFTDRGPYLVEGNAAWGEFQAECQEGLMKGAFKEIVGQLQALQAGSR